MPYLHGGDIYGGAGVEIDFSVNTTPFGVPPAVLQAVASCREEILLYPDSPVPLAQNGAGRILDRTAVL